MAVCPHWLSERIERDGPYLYHIFPSFTRREQALAEGLVPWDVQSEDGTASPYHGSHQKHESAAIEYAAFLPRPNHSYACAPWALESFCDLIRNLRPTTCPIVRIDLRQLDPAAINPDEDCFFYGRMVDYAKRGGDLGMTLWRDTGHCANAEVADVCLIDAGQETTREEILSRPYASYGEWAERIGLGDQVEHTHAAWDRFGSVAIRGGVPAAAVSPVQIQPDGSVVAPRWPLPRLPGLVLA